MKVKTRKRSTARSAELEASRRGVRGIRVSQSGEGALLRAPSRGVKSYLGWAGSGGASLVLLITGFFVLYPLALLVYGSFVVTRADGSSSYGLATWLSAINQPGMWASLLNTATRTIAT